MARARNIKPAFFDNDELAENEPLGRLLFIGLWTIADHRGNLEWRPKRVKAQLLAYDDCCIDTLAINLEQSGFVRFYSDEGITYLHIVNFTKHQNPHKNERDKGTEIPDYEESKRQVIDFKGVTINHDKSRTERNDSKSNRADSLFLIPDSLFLIPDPLADEQQQKPEQSKALSAKADRGEDIVEEVFLFWRDTMGKKSNTTLTAERKKKIQARIKSGYKLEDFKQAIINCSQTPHNMGQNDRNQPFNDIELICRTDTYLEKFRDSNAAMAAAPKMFNTATQQTMNNIQDLELE